MHEVAMEYFQFWDLIFAIIIIFCLGAIFTLGGVFMGIRAKGSAYDPILPPLRQSERVPTNIDDIDEIEVTVPEEDLGMDDLIHSTFNKMQNQEQEDRAASRRKAFNLDDQIGEDTKNV